MKNYLISFLAISLLFLTGCISRFPSYTTTSVCHDSQGRVRWPEGKFEAVNTRCASKPFAWAKKVKTVYFEAGEYEEYRESFEEAIKFWNDEMKQQVFSIAATSASADIIVRFASFEKAFGEDDHAAASARVTQYAGRSSGEIIIKTYGDTRQMYLYIAHELGHAGFGLAHDRHGIMYPDIATREGTVLGSRMKMMYWPVLENDRQAILTMIK